jgi:formate/nitrite transporter FocA (FNT family)
MCAGPIAWGCDLGFSYSLTHHTCSTGHHYVLHAISVICALIALSGLAAGWAAYKVLPEEASDEGKRPMDRAHFQIIFGIVFSIAFTVVIIAGAVPRWILNPCQ